MSDFQIGSLFVHVKDANEAANWYANLLGTSGAPGLLGRYHPVYKVTARWR
ncbi:hypothetical protein [Terribacillus sp. 7520-G]|uniref:hypothetical protein n=1 Tax=Terribacillus TaxID=459532 RepID=UPI001303FE5C|nr:hypothetical protein [Terribacillus sp. 7520-G]